MLENPNIDVNAESSSDSMKNTILVSAIKTNIIEIVQLLLLNLSIDVNKKSVFLLIFFDHTVSKCSFFNEIQDQQYFNDIKKYVCKWHF